jgi:hypothetical protein
MPAGRVGVPGYDGQRPVRRVLENFIGAERFRPLVSDPKKRAEKP